MFPTWGLLHSTKLKVRGYEAVVFPKEVASVPGPEFFTLAV
jgi:hypothetical protein